MSKPILCLDFDGVIHSYTSPWQGADIIPDPPVPGALVFIASALAVFRVAIFSSRSSTQDGIVAMQLWLNRQAMRELNPEQAGLVADGVEWPIEKPPAFLTLDDRAFTFNGVWPDLETLRQFKPWNRQPDNLKDGLLNFSVALDLLKKGLRVAREGWNGRDMFIFLVPGSHFEVNRPPLLGIYPAGTPIDYHAHIDMKTAQGDVVPYVASQTDLLAEDWLIVATMDEVGDE